MSSAERETLRNWQVERERVLPGSKFSQGLLPVAGRCQGAVNGLLISFKRLKGLIERLTGLLYVSGSHGGGRSTGSTPDCGEKLEVGGGGSRPPHQTQNTSKFTCYKSKKNNLTEGIDSNWTFNQHKS